jgi:hypothetical protein
MDRCGQGPPIVLRSIAAVSHTADAALGPLLGDKIDDVPGQPTTGAIRHAQLLSLLGFEVQFEANRDAELMAGPPLEGKRHEAQDEVQAPQGAVFLPSGASTIAVPADPFDLAAGFFLGRIVHEDPNDLAVGDTLGGPTDDSAPQLPSSLIEGAPQEDVEA